MEDKDRYIYFFHFIFFFSDDEILWLCIKQPRLVALQQLTLPDDILVWKMHQRLTVEEKKAPHHQCRDPGSGSSTTFNSHSTKRATFNSHILLPSPIFFLLYLSCLIFFAPACKRVAAAVPPRRCISSGGWTAGACFNYVKAQLKTTQYESYINLQLHTIMLQSGLKRTWRCAFRTNVK